LLVNIRKIPIAFHYEFWDLNLYLTHLWGTEIFKFWRKKECRNGSNRERRMKKCRPQC